ncbi:MAG: helix-turn-helix domain-containing protein [Adlercreutzia equolifaciens]
MSLTPKEFKILATLAQVPALCSPARLVEAAWGSEFVGETSSITVFMKLRAKIEDDPTEPRIIKTVSGIGYRLDPEACG